MSVFLFQVFLTEEEVLQGVTESLQYRVDEVSSHRVAGVESDEELIIIGDFICVVDDVDVDDAATAFRHLFCYRRCVFQEFGFYLREKVVQYFLVAFPAEMNLTNLFNIDDFCVETAAFAPKLGCC